MFPNPPTTASASPDEIHSELWSVPSVERSPFPAQMVLGCRMEPFSLVPLGALLLLLSITWHGWCHMSCDQRGFAEEMPPVRGNLALLCNSTHPTLCESPACGHSEGKKLLHDLPPPPPEGRRLLQLRSRNVLQRQAPDLFLCKKQSTWLHGKSEPGHTLVEVLGDITHTVWDRL